MNETKNEFHNFLKRDEKITMYKTCEAQDKIQEECNDHHDDHDKEEEEEKPKPLKMTEVNFLRRPNRDSSVKVLIPPGMNN